MSAGRLTEEAVPCRQATTGDFQAEKSLFFVEQSAGADTPKST